MNLTIHIFLEQCRSGGSVFNPVAEDVRSLQDEVRSAFGWSLEDDETSAREMAQHFSVPEPFGCSAWSTASRLSQLVRLQERMQSAKRLIVVGAGSESVIANEYPDTLFIAADGAVGAIDDRSRILCGVVSDGDGAEHLDSAAQSGVHIVLHAHGDNGDIWKELVATWSAFEQPPSLTLTHQSMTDYDGMFNPGGFTDGDRALCFIQMMGRSLDSVECIGFRTDSVGPWSGPTDPVRKLEKLAWMRESMHRLGVEHYLINLEGD